MKFPDDGAFISVRTKSGQRHVGYVDAGHAWSDGETETLCLAISANGDAPDHDSGQVSFTYIRIDSIESYTWDCRS
jgi:hypothetical protein